jgi:hypothetical protein
MKQLLPDEYAEDRNLLELIRQKCLLKLKIIIGGKGVVKLRKDLLNLNKNIYDIQKPLDFNPANGNSCTDNYEDQTASLIITFEKQGLKIDVSTFDFYSKYKQLKKLNKKSVK